MHADHFFVIGATHKVCEDYARSGSLKPFGTSNAFALGGDGCSGADDTDFGSRLLIRAAHNWLPFDYDIEPFCRSVAATAQTYTRTLAISHETLASTLLSLWQVGEYGALQERPHIQARVMGDGILATRDRTGVWKALEFEFPNNAPYYLKYELNHDNKARFIAAALGYDIDSRNPPSFAELLAFIERKGPAKATIKEYTWAPGELGNKPKIREFTKDMRVEEPFCYQKTYSQHFDIVLIASDGLGSFTDADNKPAETWKVLNALLPFKGLQGEFIQRRCKRAFDTFARLQWRHQDDVFIAGISNS